MSWLMLLRNRLQGFKLGSDADTGVPLVDPLFLDMPDHVALDAAARKADDGNGKSDVVISGNILSANFPPPQEAQAAGSAQGKDAAAAAAERDAHRAERRLDALLEVRIWPDKS